MSNRAGTQHCHKGIVLAGGSGSRLYPLTQAVNKHLLAIYDKPMIYYPLSTLMLANIRDILLITNPDDRAAFQRLLGGGSRFGIRLRYAVQDEPRGLADAFRVGCDFVGRDNVALVLGDNVFYGEGLQQMLAEAAGQAAGATVFASTVKTPERFGVVTFDDRQNVVSIDEKPAQTHSSWAVVGLYFYDNQVVEIADRLQPSHRGELEITDVNREYLRRGQLRCRKLGRGYAWLDMGTPESMVRASSFIATIESRQGLKVACLEEIALLKGFLSVDALRGQVESLDNDYGRYLRDRIEDLEGTL